MPLLLELCYMFSLLVNLYQLVILMSIFHDKVSQCFLSNTNNLFTARIGATRILLKWCRRHADGEEKQEVELTPAQGCRVELTDHSSCHLRLGYAANPFQCQGASSEHEW